MCEIFSNIVAFIIVKIRNVYIVKTVILVLPKKISNGIDLKSETDIAKNEVKWVKN